MSDSEPTIVLSKIDRESIQGATVVIFSTLDLHYAKYNVQLSHAVLDQDLPDAGPNQKVVYAIETAQRHLGQTLALLAKNLMG